MRKLFALIVLALAIYGCAPLKQHHRGEAPLQTYIADAKRPLASCEKNLGQKADFQFGFVEFDEFGNLFDPGSYERLLHEIRAIPGPVLIVTYLHGWRHSAAKDDDDVREFKLAMRNIAAMDGCKRKVVGIYMGWRGQVFTRTSPLDLITFWDRKQTAHNVGSGAVGEVLLRLDKERVRRNQGSMLQATSDTQSRLVFIGHSFGAAVLYTALAPILVERFTQSEGFDPSTELQTTGCVKQPKEPLKTVGDLVVLINPAFEAMRFATLHKMSVDCHYTDNQPPAIVVVTGDTDQATRKAFYAARAPRAALQKYSSDVNERFDANITAVGHYGPYQTHYLYSPSYSTEASKAQSFEGCEDYIDPSGQNAVQMSLAKSAMSTTVKFNSNTRQLDGSPKFFELQLDKISVSLEPNAPEHNPVLNIRVSSPIITGHGNFYSCQLMTFIGGLITQKISN